MCNPIITKLYQDAGGVGGMPGGMPDMECQVEVLQVVQEELVLPSRKLINLVLKIL